MPDRYNELFREFMKAPEPRVPTRDSQNALGRKQFDPEKASIAEAIMSITPILGDVLSAKDTAASLSEGNYGEAALNGVGLLPFVPGMAGAVKKVAPSATDAGQAVAEGLALTKVLDELGKPLKVYRGIKPNRPYTKEGFTYHSPSQLEAARYSQGGDVHEAYLDIRNPYLAEDGITGLTKERIAELQAQGYDGAGLIDWNKSAFPIRKDVREWVSFTPEQIIESQILK